MWHSIRSNVLAPACTRAGTFLAGLLMGHGADPSLSATVGGGVAALCLIGADFALAYVRKNMIKRAAVAEVLDGR